MAKVGNVPAAVGEAMSGENEDGGYILNRIANQLESELKRRLDIAQSFDGSKQTVPTAKLFIGYRTRLAEGYEKYMPAFEADRRLKDETKIAEDLAEKRRSWEDDAVRQPYTATFDEVQLNDPQREKECTWKFRDPKEGRQPVALAIQNYLHKYYPHAWSGDIYRRGPAQVIFVGFAPRTFLKILGIECAIRQKPLPPGVWYANSDHRDIGEALIPSEAKKAVSLTAALKTVIQSDDAPDTEYVPGVNVQMDAKIAAIVAARLGFLME